MSIETQITRITNAKASIKTAIENKGVTVPSSTKIDGYAALINNIPTGSSDKLYGYEGGQILKSGYFHAFTTASQIYCYSSTSINNLVQIGGYLPYTSSGLTVYYRIARSSTTYDYCGFADGEVITTQVAYTIGHLTGLTRTTTSSTVNRTDIPILLVKDTSGYLNIVVKNTATFSYLTAGNGIVLDRNIIVGSSSITTIADFTSYLSKTSSTFYGYGGSSGSVDESNDYWDKHNLTTAIIDSSGYNSSYYYFLITGFYLNGSGAYQNSIGVIYTQLTYMNTPVRIYVTDIDEQWSGATDTFLVSNGDMTWYEWISKNSPIFDKKTADQSFECSSTSSYVTCGGMLLSPTVYGSDQVAKYTSYDISSAE